MKVACFALCGLCLAASSSASGQDAQLIHASGTLHHGKLRGHAGCSKNGQLYRYIVPVSRLQAKVSAGHPFSTEPPEVCDCPFVHLVTLVKIGTSWQHVTAGVTDSVQANTLLKLLQVLLIRLSRQTSLGPESLRVEARGQPLQL